MRLIHAEVLDAAAALDGFRLGKYALVVTADETGVHYRYDPARPESVLARTQVDDALQTAAGRKNPINDDRTAASEPGARYIDFLIPGLLGMNLMNSGMWGIGFAVVDMRQRKLLKRFVATPMRRTDFLLALASSRLVLMIIEVGLLLGFGVLVFHMRVEGSLLSILLIGALGAVSFGGIGLLTASRAQKIESVSGLINLVMMPMWIFSGVFFSYERFPKMVLARDPGAATDGAQRCFAGHHSARRVLAVAARPDRGAGGLGWSVVRAGFALVPLELREFLKMCGQ